MPRNGSGKVPSRVAPNGYRLADPLPIGEVLTDMMKQRWLLGPSIATGGFGDIYVVNKIGDNERAVKIAKGAIQKLSADWPFVMKVDRDTGPLFAEINFYLRSAKENAIREWKEAKGLTHLGMPHYVSSGRHAPGYRFLVLQRFKIDLEQHLKSHKLTARQTLTIGVQVIDIIEYIHSTGYIHCDIKASNLLLSRDDGPQMKIFLVDFGNVEKYKMQDGSHRTHEEDLRRAHNGTLEFCSRDAHVGALSRRTDLECLGYNLLFWLAEDLPWKHEKNHEHVFALKRDYMSNVVSLIEYCLPQTEGLKPPKIAKRGRPPKSSQQSNTLQMILKKFMTDVSKLEFSQDPDYESFKKLLNNPIEDLDQIVPRKENGHSHNGDKVSPSPAKGKRKDVHHHNGHAGNGVNGNGNVANGNGHLTPRLNGNSVTPPRKVTALKKRVQTLNPTPAMLEIMRRMEKSAKNGD